MCVARPGDVVDQRDLLQAALHRKGERLSTQESELTEELATHASDYVRLTELGARLRGVQQEKGRLEDEWLAAAEQAG